MSSPNPFAPPDETFQAPPARAHGDAAGDMATALSRLAAHVADPERQAQDLAEAGPRIRKLTFGAGAATIVGVVLLGSSLDGRPGPLTVVGVVVTLVGAVLAGVSLALDLSLAPRDVASSPELALKRYLKALMAGRFGYAWASLAPSAREGTVRSPHLGAVTTQALETDLGSPQRLKLYAETFMRPSAGQMRQLTIHKISAPRQEGDVADVRANLTFYSWPQWVFVVFAVGFALFRPLGLVGAVLYFVMRKRHDVSVEKTLLRAPNGAWYLHDGDVLERRNDVQSP